MEEGRKKGSGSGSVTGVAIPSIFLMTRSTAPEQPVQVMAMLNS